MTRPKNADPNTAFTVVDEKGVIIRISLHPDVLDCEPCSEGPDVDQPVVWQCIPIYTDDTDNPILTSCRVNARNMLRGCRDIPANQIGTYLETGVFPLPKRNLSHD